ncbi:pyruvate, phosphate dikinase, partial [Sandarakinorhabdus sp.]|uniref:pyruvate, phosphate dikinase n=1 Tax=Sandarakinorhabdus sp. TaxID=1916663 RepID=UPI00286DB992
MTKSVFRFGGGSADGDARQKELLGGKGANLAEMAGIGLPVPPGLTISTPVCAAFYDAGGKLPDAVKAEVIDALAAVEAITGKAFGDAADPLLVSVRSGARVSMPGMMDTVLNLGLNDETVLGLAAASGNPRFAWDSYRRFIQMYGDVVLGLDHYLFEDALEIAKEDKGVTLDTALSAEDLMQLVARYKVLVAQNWGDEFPQDPHEQLWGAIGAVFGSWRSDRARTYRRLNDIPESWGTAVTVQAMVFGNRGDTSATGVAFTRDPSTGERVTYGEYLINAQGEDVVAGIRTPQYLTLAAREKAGARAASMEEAMPVVFGELARVFDLLENHYRDMQDIEFTVEDSRLWMLQTRSGKRTAKAALKIAVDMANEGLITEAEAVLRVEAGALDQLLHPTLDPKAPRDVIARGLPASPGAASGIVVFDSDTAETRAKLGEAVILVRTETSPEDIHGMHAARGILTARGGMTSHAAVVARGMGRPCVSGAGSLAIDHATRTMSVGGRRVAEGERITIDGATGEVMLGEVATVEPELAGDFGTLMVWADRHRRMKVRTNAETPLDCRTARQFGAEGIGLCRTEHMFFAPERITAVRQMILAEDTAGRARALALLLPAQRDDFAEIFRVMAGLPVTIRMLDPPLHEFLPHDEAGMRDVAVATGLSEATVRRRIGELHEFNPMLGHRGCRLGITYPEIYAMQARAIFEAAVLVARETGVAVVPEVMVPLVSTAREL